MIRKYLGFLLLAALALPAQVKLSQGTDRVSVEIDGKPFTDFFISASNNKPYLHPLRSASGVRVTRAFPMEMVAGETHDHPHHRGLWFAHGDVNGYDFWSAEPGKSSPKQGRITIRKILDVKNGKKAGSISALFEWIDPQYQTLLNEQRTMVFHAHPVLRMIDFDITLSALQSVKFADTKEGTFAIRLAAGLEEPHEGAPKSPPRTGKMVNSEGQSGEGSVWGKRARWVDYFGEVEGEKVGIAILDHPSNPRHPTYWHSRSYGLFAANIFGLHDFLNDKSQDGSMSLQPGQSLRFRYRVVIHPGDAPGAGVAEMYRAYAATK